MHKTKEIVGYRNGRRDHSVIRELAGLVILPSTLLVAVDQLQPNCGLALPSMLMLLMESPLRRLSVNAFGEEVYRMVRSYSLRTSVGGGMGKSLEHWM